MALTELKFAGNPNATQVNIKITLTEAGKARARAVVGMRADEVIGDGTLALFMADDGVVVRNPVLAERNTRVHAAMPPDLHNLIAVALDRQMLTDVIRGGVEVFFDRLCSREGALARLLFDE